MGLFNVEFRNIPLFYFHNKYLVIALFLFFTIAALISSCSCKACIIALCFITGNTFYTKSMDDSMDESSFALAGDLISMTNVFINQIYVILMLYSWQYLLRRKNGLKWKQDHSQSGENTLILGPHSKTVL